MAKTEKEYPNDTTGGRIQHLRRERGMTREQFYDAINHHTFNLNVDAAPESKARTVKHWESERTQLNYEGLIAACEVLDCDSDYLLLLQQEPHKEGIQIAEETGLSYEAVEKLRNRRKWEVLSIISALILSDIPDSIFSAVEAVYVDGYVERKGRLPIQVRAKVLCAAEKTAIIEDILQFIDKLRADRGHAPLGQEVENGEEE